MPRPRVSYADLPVGVYFKHGAFYRVVKGKWLRLGTTVEEAMAASKDAAPREPSSREVILAYLLRKFAAIRQNAKARNLVFELTREDVPMLLAASGWRCAVTGSAFSLDAINGKRPMAPSIDRINSSDGYARTNCRVVCLAANLAMNVWGDDVIRRMLRPAKSIRRLLDGDPES